MAQTCLDTLSVHSKRSEQLKRDMKSILTCIARQICVLGVEQDRCPKSAFVNSKPISTFKMVLQPFLLLL